MHEAIPELLAAGRRMSELGLVTGTAGNLSVRVGPDTVLITPSSVAYELIGADQVCEMSLGDGAQRGGTGVPSSEWPMHRLVYERSGTTAVVHTHSLCATAVSTLVAELPAIHYYILGLGGDTVRVAPFAPFGSVELAAAVSVALEDRTAALLQNHGAISCGLTLAEACARAESLEWLCRLYLTARASGLEPRILSAEELDGVRGQHRRRSRKPGAGR